MLENLEHFLLYFVFIFYIFIIICDRFFFSFLLCDTMHIERYCYSKSSIRLSVHL